MKRKALVSGSFDPVTVGHLDLIARASSLFDEVYAVVFSNTEKNSLLDAPLRRDLLSASCASLPNVTVDVFEGLLCDYTAKQGISFIVRGVRDASDVPYEMMLSTINRGLGNSPETIFLPARPEYFHISSSYVRDMIRYRQRLDGILPQEALALLKARRPDLF